MYAIEKWGMQRVQHGGQLVGVHVVHGFAFKDRLRHSDGDFVAVANFVLVAIERRGGFGRRRYRYVESRSECGIHLRRETEHRLGEILLHSVALRAAHEFLGIDRACRLHREVPLPDENDAGDEALHRSKRRERAALEFECAHVHRQREIVHRVGLAESHIAERAVALVGVGERAGFFGHVHGGLLASDFQRDGKGSGAAHLDRGGELIETGLGDTHGVVPCRQIRRGEFSCRVGRQHDRLRQRVAADFDLCSGNHRAGRVLHRAAQRVACEARRKRQRNREQRRQRHI